MRDRLLRMTLALTVLLAGAAPALAEPCDWPAFRGPTGQGHSQAESVPLEWGEGENVAWKRAIPGEGWSSPVVRDGRVYLTAAVPADDGGHGLHAICLDAQTGEPIWNTRVFRQGSNAPRIHRKNSHASPTPIVTDGRLYVHFGHQGTACLDLTGEIVWTNRSLRYNPVHGNGGSPVLHDGKLIFNVDGAEEQFIVALDEETGEVVWRTPRSREVRAGFSFSTPLVVEIDGREQIISPASGAVYSYAPDTGEELWRVDYGDGYSVVPRPVYAEGLVFVCTGFNRPDLLAIDPTGSGNATDTHIRWRTGKTIPTIPSPVAVGGELYVVSDDGVATCFDAESGEVHWRQRLDGPVSASPVHADGRIYFQLENGETVVIAPGTEYEELARNSLEAEKVQASYAVCDGAIFIRTEGHLYRIGEAR